MQTLEDDKQVDKSSENFDDIINRNFSPDEISDMEDRASEGLDDSKSEVDGERDSLDKGGYYRPDKDGGSNNAQATSNKKKAGIGMGVIGLLFGGGLGIFGLLAQPLQFLQMAGMLRNFHFSDGENLSDSRMTRISRYIKYGGDERTRLSYLGNKYANKVEAKLNKSGLKSTYTGKGRIFSGYEVDLTKNSAALGDISNKSPDEVTKMLAKRYGIDPSKITSAGNNKLNISAEGLNTRESKRLLRNSLVDAGYSRVGAAMRARIMGKRGLVTWNPIKKYDAKIKASAKARIADFFEARKNRINNGADPPIKSVSENQKDTDGDKQPDTDKTNSEAADSANKSLGDTPDGLKSKIANGVGGSAAVVGILCLAKALSNQYDTIKHANVVLPLIRLGVEGMAVGDQILTGENLDPAQLDAMTELMYSEETQTSYRTARSIQYEAGEKLTGKDVLPEGKIDSEGNVLSQFLNAVPGLDPVCDVVTSTIGGIALSLLTGGPIGTIVEEVIGRVALGPLINGLVNWIAGNPIDVQVAGADYGNYINYGARLAANDANISAGGVKLTSAEVAELRSIRLEEENYEFSQKSFFAKIFDAKDYRTPAGKFIANQAPDPAQNIARVASSAPRFIGNIFSPITGLLTAKTGASEDYDYGFDKYGFANSEVESSVIENPFENDEIVANLLDAKAAEISEKTTKCFGIKIEKRTIGGKSVWTPVSGNDVPQYKDIDEDCSDRSEEFLRIRMWIHDSQLMTATACFEDGEDNTCEDFGFTAQAQSSPQISAPGLNGYAIPCQGEPKVATRLSGKGGAIDWSGITNSGVIGTNSDGKDIAVYIRNACVTTNIKTIVVASSIHGSENVGQLVAHELLFNTDLPPNIKVIAIPEINGYGVENFRRKNKNGVDLNRNFPERWSSLTGEELDPSSDFYRGTSAGSEPETSSVMNFLKSIGKTDLFLSYHHDLSYAASVGNTSPAIGKAYADEVGIGNSNSNGDTVINQRGSLDLWYNVETSSPTVLVELKSSSYYNTEEKIKAEVRALLEAFNTAQGQTTSGSGPR